MPRLLQSIRNPRDLRQLPVAKLARVAQELRESIRARFQMRDECLESALGTADLTVAMHYVFDFSHDKVVFDLAHQATPHLVLTRPELTPDGEVSERVIPVSPGEEREPYDNFFARHAGTSISKALGLAAARGDGGKTVAVIGDGAIVSGIALEALNSGSELEDDVLVILNDNEMSVSKVVGAMGEYLSKIRVGRTYNDMKRDAHKLLQAIPFIGESLDKAAEQLKEVVAKALVPGAIFEKLGPRYFGPVDGHNVAHLVQLLQEIKKQKGFYLLHAITRREDWRATDDGSRPLGAPPPFTGVLEFKRQGEQSYDLALAEALTEAARDDERVAVMVMAPPDVEGPGQLAARLRRHLPGRVWNTQITESHGVAFAAGLARGGHKPVVVSPASLLHRAHDQIFQEVALSGLPVVFCVAYAGIVGAGAGLYHGSDDLAFLRALPGIDLMSPRDARELGAMLSLSMDQAGPSVIRMPHGFTAHPDHVFEERAELVRGKPEILRRGSDVVVLALGATVYPMMEAADLLAEKGIEATVVNARFVRPLDVDFVRKMFDEHTVVFTSEEHRLSGGFGAAVLECAAVERLGAGKVIPVALPDGPLPLGRRSQVLRRLGLDPQGLADRMLYGYRRHVRSAPR